MALKLVVDSSVIVKWLNSTNDKNLGEADKILAVAIKGDIQLIAPELAKYEVGNVLLLKKKLSIKEVELLFHGLFAYPIQFIPESEELARETYSLAFELGITYYDASFISLAKHYDATLVTENIKHQGKAENVKAVTLNEFSRKSL